MNSLITYPEYRLPELTQEQKKAVAEVETRFPDYIPDKETVPVKAGVYYLILKNKLKSVENPGPESRPNGNTDKKFLMSLAIEIARQHFKFYEEDDQKKIVKNLQGDIQQLTEEKKNFEGRIRKLENDQTTWGIGGFLGGIVITAFIAGGVWAWSKK